MTMSDLFLKFTVKTILLTVFIALISGLFFYFNFPDFYLSIFPYLLGFVALITLSVYYVVLKGVQNKSAQAFNLYFMGASMAKLLLFVFFFLIYMLFIQEQIVKFSIVFLLLYFIYTSFEVKQLLNLVKQKSPNDK
jgi:hypothetical protein